VLWKPVIEVRLALHQASVEASAPAVAEFEKAQAAAAKSKASDDEAAPDEADAAEKPDPLISKLAGSLPVERFTATVEVQDAEAAPEGGSPSTKSAKGGK
jgi:hypothetical protein